MFSGLVVPNCLLNPVNVLTDSGECPEEAVGLVNCIESDLVPSVVIVFAANQGAPTVSLSW